MTNFRRDGGKDMTIKKFYFDLLLIHNEGRRKVKWFYTKNGFSASENQFSRGQTTRSPHPRSKISVQYPGPLLLVGLIFHTIHNKPFFVLTDYRKDTRDN